MTEFSKVFIDTALFIYCFEDNEYYAEIVESLFKQIIDNESILTTSTISIMEFSVKPFQLGRLEVVEEFKDFLIDFNFKTFSVNVLVAEEAARLRARYKFLKSMDAIQLATALVYKCTHFYTNDKQLQQVKEIEVITLDRFAKKD